MTTRRTFLASLFAVLAAWFGFRAAKAEQVIPPAGITKPPGFSPLMTTVRLWLRPADDGSGMIQSTFFNGVESTRLFVPVGNPWPYGDGLVVVKLDGRPMLVPWRSG